MAKPREREKRGNGEGSIYQECDSCRKRMEKGKCPECGSRKGRWVAWATTGWVVIDGEKKRERKKLYADRDDNTREAVATKLAKLLTEKNEGDLPTKADEKETVAEYMAKWLGHRKMMMLADPKKFRPKTYDNYVQYTKKHIIPALGEIRLLELTADHIDRLYASILKKGHNRTALMVHQVLHAALAHAVRRRRLRYNPAAEAHKPDYQPKKGTALTVEECEALIRNLRSERIYALYILMMYSGIRRAEACGLRWRDVNRETIWDEETKSYTEVGYLSIEKAAEQISKELADEIRNDLAERPESNVLEQNDGNVVITPPKTDLSKREIPIPQAALLILDEHRQRQEAERLSAGDAWQDNDLIFCRPDGSHLLPNHVSRRWTIIRSRLKLPEITPHQLRHTFATLIIEKTGDYKTAQELLGHSTIHVTMKTYSHVTKKMQTRALKTIASALPSAEDVRKVQERAPH